MVSNHADIEWCHGKHMTFDLAKLFKTHHSTADAGLMWLWKKKNGEGFSLGRTPHCLKLLHVCPTAAFSCFQGYWKGHKFLHPISGASNDDVFWDRWQYAVKVQRSLAPLSRFVVHTFLMRMNKNVVDFRVMRTLCDRLWNLQAKIYIAWTTFLGSTTTDHVITSCDVGL